LQADRYPGDPELQIRIAILHQDGFGRVLQTKQEVEPGKAWVVLEDGTLKLKEDGQPEEAEATRRWRVSEPVEYNNKGEKVRIYRPYFADQFRRINDDSLRVFAYHDQQFYDAAGRPTHTILAKKMPQGENSELKRCAGNSATAAGTSSPSMKTICLMSRPQQHGASTERCIDASH
jgi:hypothetical protein